MVMMILIMFTGVGAAILAAVQYLDNENDQQKLKSWISDLQTANNNLSKQIETLSHNNETSKRAADQAQLELKELQMKNIENLLALSDAYKKNSILESERSNYLTGGNAIPLIYTKLMNYPPVVPSRQNDPKLVELQGKWVLEFALQNSKKYLLTNIKTYRIRTGSYTTRLDQHFPPIMILGPKEERELQPKEIFSDPSNVDLIYEVGVEWKLYKYTLTTRLTKNQVIDPETNIPKFIIIKEQEYYTYNKKTYNNLEELKAAIQSDMAVDRNFN